MNSLSPHDDPDASDLARLVEQFLDPAWYRTRYPDIAAADQNSLQHYINYGAAERRDPNGFFDCAWYIEHYPDVASSGLHPLLHYLRAGAAELRHPHPRFDAVYYAQQHPEAAENPVLYHLRVGAARGYLTEKRIEIRDYLPSEAPALFLPRGIFTDVVIHVRCGFDETRRCIRSVLADRSLPLARIIVIEDRSPEPDLSAWLRQLAADGVIYLIRNRQRLGFAASVNLGVKAAEDHDVVLLASDAEVPAGWLRRLAAHAYAEADIATVSPFCDHGWIGGQTSDNSVRIDTVCQTVNAGRSADVPVTNTQCMYVRRDALIAADTLFADDATGDDFHQPATKADWRHRLACDTFVRVEQRSVQPVAAAVLPSWFCLTARVFRDSKLPVILMVSHNFGGGVRRHIGALVERYADTAHVLLLEGTDRGAALSVPSFSGDPVLTLPPDRLDDLVTVLRSANVSRVHIHHLLQIDMDIRALIHRLGVPFDVTVHDYYALCPQINLLRWSEGIYCGEPGPAACNACISDQSSHGARDIVSWRRERTWQFLEADRVICPSEDVKVRLDRHGVGGRASVVPHEQQTDLVWTTSVPKIADQPLRIVLLGVLANHKGARTVAEVAEAAEPATIELHLIGHLEDSFPKHAVKLIKATGEYRDQDLPRLLKRIDPHMFWFPSSAAETYSFTLSAAIATGLPIVATDLGSFTERLARRPRTWLVDHRASARDWLAVFDAVRTALLGRMDKRAVPRQRVISDFYTKRYLSPAPRPVPQAIANRPRIAIVPERHDSGGMTPCAYVRLLQPLDHLAAGGRFDILMADATTIFDFTADVIVTQRHAIPDLDAAGHLADHARRTGAKLLFDLDDDLMSVPSLHPDADRLRPHARVVRGMLKLADVVWVSTPGLAERVEAIRPDAVVMENRLDERIWAHVPEPASFHDDPVRILCMGTTSHEHDFEMVEPVLLRLKAEYGDRIVIDVLGMTRRSELPAALTRVGPPAHASRSYPGFVHWLTAMQPRWHIGLAPLLDTPFNRSKSPIKAMDYAAMGLAVLASDTQVYRGSIADGVGGCLVANDPRTWHAALDWLIRNQDLRRSLATKAHQAFRAHATLASHAKTRAAALAALMADGGADLRPTRPTPRIEHDSTDPATRKKRHSGGGR